MTLYININEEKSLFFPFLTDFETVDLIFRNNQTNRYYEISLLKDYQTQRGFSANIEVTGKDEEPYYEIDETFNSTTLNIPSGDYTVIGEDNDGIARIIMLHIVNPKHSDTYKTENKNITYEG